MSDTNGVYILRFDCGPIHNQDRTISLHATAEGAQRQAIELFRRYAKELLNKFFKDFTEILRENGESLAIINEDTTDVDLYRMLIDTDDPNGVDATFDGLLELLSCVCWQTTQQCRYCNKNEYTLEVIIYKDIVKN